MMKHKYRNGTLFMVKAFSRLVMQKVALPILLLCMPFVSIVALPTRASASSGNASNATSVEQSLQELIKMTDSEIPAAFSNLVSSRLKYISIRSLSGKEGKWMAFVDIYQCYEDGLPSKYVLQQASVQYGMQPSMPTGTKNCTLTIGSISNTITYNKQAMFNFSGNLALATDAADADAKVTVTVDKETIPITLTQVFPSKKVVSAQKALNQMASAYVQYCQKEGVKSFDHSFMRLKSYLQDMESMSQGYIWELYLVNSKSLPSKATVIRYDFDSEKVLISEKEVRSYFS